METVEQLAELVELVGGHGDIYLRYSHGPERDAAQSSRDYEADVELPGLPVTPLMPPDWWPRPAQDWIARRVCKYLDLADADPSRRPWLLTGKPVADGPDHEPLLVDVEPIAWLADRVVEQARQIYHDRFEVGRDSAG
jgi:hypothetical protein